MGVTVVVPTEVVVVVGVDAAVNGHEEPKYSSAQAALRSVWFNLKHSLIAIYFASVVSLPHKFVVVEAGATVVVVACGVIHVVWLTIAGAIHLFVH